MSILSKINDWLARKNLEQAVKQAKATKTPVNWDSYPRGTVLSCQVLQNGVICGELKDEEGNKHLYTASRSDIHEPIPIGVTVAYHLRPRDVLPRREVVKVISENQPEQK